MKSDIAEVEAVVWRYLHALHVGDVDALRQAFAPGSALYAAINGEATALAVEPWLERVQNRKSPEASGFKSQNRILSIEVEGDMAMAKVTSAFPPKRFVDYLSLVRTVSAWRIAAKTYHAEDIPAA
ncbi:nuclear transport factor 2 family protein [Aquamicrobium sp. NLF2-7]|uniref:nuclear transport factor 2 family protein n=1 Tax=Aquamicrobium sp. NLF2-7 TaxID=2918753 RepID=UPI001EFACE2C|nr:nuclear transport factor 2 family protein [Aquamicrobium sp. NLF2-7]MCG8274569.1 nuclear transport factor 2 family protein [Aquamicrobium sp. NLF2-7]MCG8274600.1 nuclear transport factor 2 family protein [Aquamicrobium sp. NLF2-7]